MLSRRHWQIRDHRETAFPNYWRISRTRGLCFPTLACVIRRNTRNRFRQVLPRFKVSKQKVVHVALFTMDRARAGAGRTAQSTLFLHPTQELHSVTMLFGN